MDPTRATWPSSFVLSLFRSFAHAHARAMFDRHERGSERRIRFRSRPISLDSGKNVPSEGREVRGGTRAKSLAKFVNFRVLEARTLSNNSADAPPREAQ